jgi:hypothetical protein
MMTIVCAMGKTPLCHESSVQEMPNGLRTTVS